MTASAPPTSSRFHRLRQLVDNPVTVKELRSRMRGARAFVILTTYVLLLSAFVGIVYAAYASAANSPIGPNARQAGQPIFVTVLGIQILVVAFLGPSFTMGAISGEKERQTFDLLRTTLLSAHSLVLGKLLSALSFIVLLILAAVPLQSFAFFLGGVAPVEVLISQVLILVSAVTFALLGLFFSAIMRSTLAASVATFALTLFLLFGLPAFVLMVAGFGASIFFGAGPTTWIQEVLLLYGGLLLASLNLPATLIVSEVILLENSALFLFSETFGGRTVYFFSPWWVYLVLYTLIAFLLYWLCVRAVRRVPVR